MHAGEMVFQLPRFDAHLFPPLLRVLDAAVAATNGAAGAGRSAGSAGGRHSACAPGAAHAWNSAGRVRAQGLQVAAQFLVA
eukprot:1161645-Pelagomonas_calceolata.AAC.25